MREVDLNCDMGEGMGDDVGLLEFVTSANIACGVHAGDRRTMETTMRAAIARDVAVGAHPSYPDREHFGRISMVLPPKEIEELVIEQIETLAQIAAANGIRLSHVKPHGALYNDAARDEKLAGVIAAAIRRTDAALIFIGLAGSKMLDAGKKAGLRIAAEAFCDRAYESDGSLRSRSLPGAVHHDPELASRQALDIAVHQRVRTHDGEMIVIEAGTLCIHGDSPNAVAMTRAVRAALEEAGVVVRRLA